MTKPVSIGITTSHFIHMSQCRNKLKKILCRTLCAIALLGETALLTSPMTAHAAIAADFSSLVERVSPSVVRVNVTKKISEDDLAKAKTAQILREFLGNRADIPDVTPAIEYTYGTGFFISKDGYILTNHHVVEGAGTVTITLKDRSELDAKIIGSDESSDIAVLKIAGNSYPALPVGDSNTLKVGEPVLAIGSPFGFDYSASAGIVSAKSRNFSREATVPFIQSDVALNPGNSGGPLFNQKGEVVGVNSRIFSGTGGYMGLSFSIPMDTAMDIYNQIKKTGKVVRAYLGVTVQDIDRNLAEAYKLERPQGALLTRVTPDSPAHKAGLRAGDIILTFNGTNIKEASGLLNLINRARPNDSFTIERQQNGKRSKVQGKLIEAPSEMQSMPSTKNDGIVLGVRLRTLSANESKTLGVNGVLITALDPIGLAARSGLQAGDVVVSLNQRRTRNAQEFSNIVASLPKQGVVTIELLRQGSPAIIGLRIE